MKLDVTVDGRAASLNFENGKFSYQRETQAPIEREFSAVPLAPGTWSVLIDGRSYSVIAAGGVIRVNGRAFSVEVFDPRAMRTRKAGARAKGARTLPR